MSNRPIVMICSFLFLLLSACSDPIRDNPFDPQSGHYQPPLEVAAVVRSVHVQPDSAGLDSLWLMAELSCITDDPIAAVKVVFHDPDGIQLSNEDINIWRKRLFREDLGILGSFEPVLGQPFTFVIRTVGGDIFEHGPVFLHRIIDEVPVLQSTVLPTNIHFTWDTILLDYPFVCRIEVTAEADADSAMWTSVVWTRVVAPPVVHVVCPVPESGPNYRATLTVIDCDGNSSTSAEVDAK